MSLFPDYQPVTPDVLTALIAMLDSDRVSTRDADRARHSRDQSFHAAHFPDAVLYPESAQEISQVLRFATERRIPVTPYGTGSSLEGNPIPMYGGIVLNFSRMNRILAIRPQEFQIDVQAGVGRYEVNAAAAQHRLFFPPDPGANAMIGGMIGNNSSGTKTIKYGATRDNVMQMEVVKADGSILTVGSRTRKDSSSFGLLHLFIGAEGTLGIVTAATLKLHVLPQNFSAVLAAFPTIQAAMQTVLQIMAAGLDPSALELMDSETIRAIRTGKGMHDLTVAPTVIMEFNGASDNEGLAAALDICRENGATDFRSARGKEERDALWETRHHTYDTLMALHPTQSQLIMDCCVPLTQYPVLVSFAADVLDEYGVMGYKFGHAGDGNLHINLMYDPKVPAELERAREVNAIIVRRAIELGGTATGEHGIGIGKRGFMEQQHGSSLETMRQIKTLFDPAWILNPGKMFLPEGISLNEYPVIQPQD